MTEQILTLVSDLPAVGLHIFFFFAALIENLFPPWPGDTFIVFAGFLSAHHVVSLPAALISTGTGSLVGAWIMYLAGEKILHLARSAHSRLKPGLMQRMLSDFVSDEQMEKTQRWFLRWGAWLVVVSRFSAGIRYFVSIVAGLSKMNPVLFTVCFSLGVVVWNMLLLTGGRLLAENWRKMLEWLQIYNVAVGALIGMILVFLIFRWWRGVRDRSAS
jgi:membrane protein DedA with SNARE-associated domain